MYNNVITLIKKSNCLVNVYDVVERYMSLFISLIYIVISLLSNKENLCLVISLPHHYSLLNKK